MNEHVAKKQLLYSAISAIILFLYFYAVKELSDKNIVSNIILYAGAIIIFLIAYLFCNFVLKKVSLNKNSEKLLTFAIVFLSTTWMVKAFFEETVPPNFTTRYLRHTMPSYLYFILLLMSCFFIFAVVRKRTDNTSKLLRISLGILFIVIETIFLYVPNIFNDTLGGPYHAEAYINSIVNVLNAFPYENWRTSIYGHYALFFYLPVSILKIFGVNEWIAIITSIALFGSICFFAETLLIHKLIKNDSFYALTLTANAVLNTQIIDGTYYQINPHRILFPALILLLSYYYFQSNNKKEKLYLFFLWVSSSCSIIWNFETGIICTFVCFLVCVYKQCAQIQKIKSRIICKNIGITAIAGFMAFSIVNIYNKLCGGGWVSIKEYLYPIGSAEYSINDLLTLPLGTPFIGYFFALVVLLSVICYQLQKIFFLKADANELMQTLLAITGLGLLTYYMNRVVNTNMTISAFEIILVLSMILDKNVHIISENNTSIKQINITQGSFLIGLTILTSICLSTVGSIGIRIKTYYETVCSTDQLDTVLLTLENAIPDSGEVAFVGKTTTIFSSMLNRKKGLYTMDFEDIFTTDNTLINPQALEYVKNELISGKWDYLFIYEDCLPYIPNGYDVIWNDMEGYYIYAKK